MDKTAEQIAYDVLAQMEKVALSTELIRRAVMGSKVPYVGNFAQLTPQGKAGMLKILEAKHPRAVARFRGEPAPVRGARPAASAPAPASAEADQWAMEQASRGFDASSQGFDDALRSFDERMSQSYADDALRNFDDPWGGFGRRF